LSSTPEPTELATVLAMVKDASRRSCGGLRPSLTMAALGGALLAGRGEGMIVRPSNKGMDGTQNTGASQADSQLANSICHVEEANPRRHPFKIWHRTHRILNAPIRFDHRRDSKSVTHQFNLPHLKVLAITCGKNHGAAGC
jgi:hypothetical protein